MSLKLFSIGEGSYLHTYSLSSNRHLAQYNVLGSSVIHGIKGKSTLHVTFFCNNGFKYKFCQGFINNLPGQEKTT